MITIGRSYELEVVKQVDFGLYLDAGELGEVLLPKKSVPAGTAVGDRIEVFLYLDSQDLPVATTRKPRARVGEFAYLEAVAKTAVGVFLDWGLEKELLVPFAEQHRPMEVGKYYLVYLYIDPRDGRIVASSKIDRFVADEPTRSYRAGQKVDLIIANSTDLGFKAIVDHSFWGLLYRDEVFERLSFGQRKRGFIKRVRSDGRVDLSLSGGRQSRDRNAALILDYLKQQGGFVPLHDKSDPALIQRLFGISKGAFKKAIGGLYKERLIVIEKDGIRLR